MSQLTPPNVFGIIVRTIALMIVIYGLHYLVWPFVAKCTGAISPPNQYEREGVITSIIQIAFGAILMRRAKLVVMYAYRGATEAPAPAPNQPPE